MEKILFSLIGIASLSALSAGAPLVSLDMPEIRLWTPMTTSWYGSNFHGLQSADGSTYNMYEYTVAHRTYPLGTKLELRNPDNEKTVIVTVTDRGPWNPSSVPASREQAKYRSNLRVHPTRQLDVSYAIARDLDFLEEGVIRLQVRKIHSQTVSVR